MRLLTKYQFMRYLGRTPAKSVVFEVSPRFVFAEFVCLALTGAAVSLESLFAGGKTDSAFFVPDRKPGMVGSNISKDQRPMKLIKVDDTGNAVVEFYHDELLIISSILKSAPCPFDDKNAGGSVLLSMALEESLRTFGIMAKHCSDNEDSKDINEMLSVDSDAIINEYNCKGGSNECR